MNCNLSRHFSSSISLLGNHLVKHILGQIFCCLKNAVVNFVWLGMVPNEKKRRKNWYSQSLHLTFTVSIAIIERMDESHFVPKTEREGVFATLHLELQQLQLTLLIFLLEDATSIKEASKTSERPLTKQ